MLRQHQEAQQEVKEKVNRKKKQTFKQDPSIKLLYLQQQEQELAKSLVLVKNPAQPTAHGSQPEVGSLIEWLGQASFLIDKIINYALKDRVIIDIVIMQKNSFVLDRSGQAILKKLYLAPNARGEIAISHGLEQKIDPERIRTKEIESLYIKFIVYQTRPQLEDTLLGWAYHPLFSKKEAFERGQLELNYQPNLGSFQVQLRELPL